jgi:hypothetical protein
MGGESACIFFHVIHPTLFPALVNDNTEVLGNRRWVAT